MALTSAATTSLTGVAIPYFLPNSTMAPFKASISVFLGYVDSSWEKYPGCAALLVWGLDEHALDEIKMFCVACDEDGVQKQSRCSDESIDRI